MKKIMIIDDELDISDVLERFLGREKNYSINTYSNPNNALQELQREHYDLVLTDIMMPLVNGLDILEQIKQFSPRTKVILMTAYSTDKKIKKSETLHADGYLEKPFQSLKDVELAIETALHNN